jgi:hypothetical protein
MSVPKLEIAGSRNFSSWLREERVSLAFTTYQTGKLFLIGLRPDGKLSIFERTFERCMGLAVADAAERGTPNEESRSASAQTLWMSSIYQLWRFENALPADQRAPEGYDRLYVPQLATRRAMWMRMISLSVIRSTRHSPPGTRHFSSTPSSPALRRRARRTAFA